ADPAARPGPEPPAAATTEPNRSDAAQPFAGVLYYTDESCVLRAVALPDLAEVPAPSWDGCRFRLSPDETRAAGPETGWDRHSDPRIGRVFQVRDGVVSVATDLGPEGEVEGSAAAWKPDGTLTYFGDGALREWPDGEVVLSQRDLLGSLETSGLDGSSEARATIREARWLDATRLAAIVALEGPDIVGADLLAIFEGRGLVASAGSPRDAERLADLRASDGGEFVSVRNGIRGEVLVVNGRGRSVAIPALPSIRALEFSPDGQWAAASTDEATFVFRPGSTSTTARLAIVARDLDWRGGTVTDSPAAADDVREWLEDVGATGRLFVTLPGCTLRALELPSLRWAEEPDERSPCRFTLAADGSPVAEEASVAPDGSRSTLCQAGGLDVFDGSGLERSIPGACGAAWTQEGTLTFLRAGELWRGLERPRRILSRAELAEIFGRPSALEEVAWIDDRSFWAVVRSGGSAIVAAMTPDRLVYSPTFTTSEIEGLRVSATGMVAARTDRGVVFFDSGGRRALTFPSGTAVTWAPGELYAAVATATEILVVAPVSREVVALPLAVRDLEWAPP
ncbi:MAG TPA: hypothetical protein VD704_04285, partial [Gaiellaceae bacterium]|nr:hypothetical protein [Gaiellaceae bacterium]